MILILCLGLLQDTTSSDTADIVKYEAKSITYDLEKSLIILNDSSIINYKDITLLSDSAYYHVENNQLEAFGQCDLRQATDSIKGNYLRYNIENRKALMIDGKTQIEKGFLEGEKIYWISEQTVNAYSGRYTTCNDSPPHYYFYAPKMKVYLGDMVIAGPIFLYIQSIPVLGAPFWFVPISSKRKSGLLPFRLGNSREFGKFIRGFAYYLVISDYADVTFQLDAMEKKGIMPHIETAWDYAPFSKGTIYGSFINDIDKKSRRYSIEARNNSELFLFGSSFNCDIKYVSDNSYRQDYAETTTVWLEKEITSQATMSRELIGFKNTLVYERREDFTDTTIQEKLPYYTLTGPSQMLFSYINYSLSGHISRNRNVSPNDTVTLTGANIHTAPSLQQNFLNAITITPSLNLDFAIYERDTAGAEWPSRFGYSFVTNASTNFYRVFNINVLGMRGVLHKILPRITYSYTPDFDFGRFPAVSGIPRFAHRNRIDFGIEQEFEAKIGDEELRKSRILRMVLNSGYNLLTDSLSSIALSFDFPHNPLPKPVTQFDTHIDGSINPYTRDYTYTITNAIGVNLNFFSINFNQSYKRGGTYQIWFNGNIKPTRNWSLSYAARYDWENKRFVDYQFNINRDLHCWEAVFSFNQLGDTWRYDFKVRIKQIPEVAIGKGLLGYILE